jgi:hypothetical protein
MAHTPGPGLNSEAGEGGLQDWYDAVKDQAREISPGLGAALDLSSISSA